MRMHSYEFAFLLMGPYGYHFRKTTAFPPEAVRRPQTGASARPHPDGCPSGQTGPYGRLGGQTTARLGGSAFGRYPKIYQSGQTRRDNKISKRGPKVLRWALYMAAVASLRHNKEMRTLYHKKLSQGKTEKQALICVAKKLLQIALSLLKSGETYNPARVFVSY